MSDNTTTPEPLLTPEDLERLGFKKEEHPWVTEYVCQIEGTRAKLVLSPHPLNEACMFIRHPDDSIIQVRPESLEDVEVIKRMLAYSHCENDLEVWFSGEEEEE